MLFILKSGAQWHFGMLRPFMFIFEDKVLGGSTRQPLHHCLPQVCGILHRCVKYFTSGVSFNHKLNLNMLETIWDQIVGFKAECCISQLRTQYSMSWFSIEWMMIARITLKIRKDHLSFFNRVKGRFHAKSSQFKHKPTRAKSMSELSDVKSCFFIDADILLTCGHSPYSDHST